jgi:hypothetical protein
MMDFHGRPPAICCDNAPELTNRAFGIPMRFPYASAQSPDGAQNKEPLEDAATPEKLVHR